MLLGTVRLRHPSPHPRRIAPALQFTFSSCSPDCELGQTSAVCSSFRCGQGALRLQVNAPRVKSRVVEVLRDSAAAIRGRRRLRRGACATAPWSPSASPPPPRTPFRTTVRSKPASALAQTSYCLFCTVHFDKFLSTSRFLILSRS